jgi:hypothetical protein
MQNPSHQGATCPVRTQAPVVLIVHMSRNRQVSNINCFLEGTVAKCEQYIRRKNLGYNADRHFHISIFTCRMPILFGTVATLSFRQTTCRARCKSWTHSFTQVQVGHWRAM